MKIDVRQKIEEYQISNVHVHSYHSLLKRYYDHEAYTDNHMQHVLDQNLPMFPTEQKFIKFSVVVIDESQDMTPLYY